MELDLKGETRSFSTGLNLPSGSVLKNGVMDFSQAQFSDLVPYRNGAAYVCGSGSIDPLPGLAADIEQTDLEITFASDHTLTPGDIFCIYDPSDFSWSSARSNYHAGEWCKVVHVISPTKVMIDAPLWASYTASNVELHRMMPWTGTFENITIIGNSEETGLTYGIALDLSSDVTLQSVTVSEARYAAIELSRTVGFCVEGCSASQDAINSAGGEYGLELANSQRGTIDRCHFVASRHGISHGGYDGPGSVPVRDITHRDSSASETRHLDGATGFDIHTNSEAIRIIDCVFPTGVNVGGRDIAFERCRIYNQPGVDFCFVAGPMVGGKISFRDCRFLALRDANPTGRGVVDFGGNSLPGEHLKDDLHIEIINSEYQGNSEDFVRFIRLRNNSRTYKMNLTIRGLLVDAPQTLQLFSVKNVSGMPTPDLYELTAIRMFSGTVISLDGSPPPNYLYLD